MTPDEQLQFEMEMAQAEIEAAQGSSGSKPVSLFDALTGAVGTVSQGGTFNYADELIGRGLAATDALNQSLFGNLPFSQISDVYNQRKEPMTDYVRGEIAASRQAAPVISTVGDMATSFANPATKLIGKGTAALSAAPSIIRAPAQVAGAGTVLGALYGAGAAEGDERLDAAMEGAAYGGLTDAALYGTGRGLKKVAEKFNSQADPLRASAIGITKADRAKAIKPAREAKKFLQTGRDAVDRSLDVVEKYGIIDDVDPQKIVARNSEVIDGLAVKAGQIINGADQVRNQDIPEISFSDVEQWIRKRTVGTERQKLLKLLDKEASLINESLDGSFRTLQNTKINLGTKTYAVDTNTTQKTFYRKLTNQVKRHLEEHLSYLTSSGKLPQGTAADFRGINADYEALIKFQDEFLRNAAKDKGEDFVRDSLIPLIKTTGGLGVPILASAYTGDPSYAVGGVAAYGAMTPQGRKALADLARSGKISAPGDFIQNNRERITSTILGGND